MFKMFGFYITIFFVLNKWMIKLIVYPYVISIFFLMKFDFGWESIIYATYPRIEVFLDQSVGEKFYFILFFW